MISRRDDHTSSGNDTPMLLLSEEGRIRLCNAAASRLFRSPAEKLIGAPIASLLTDFSMDTRRSEPVGTCDWRPAKGIHPDGNSFSLEISAIEPVVLDGQTAFLLCLRTMREPSEPSHHFGRLLETLETCKSSVFVTDRLGIIEYANGAFEKLTGFSRGEVIGKTPAMFQADGPLSRLHAECWHSLKAGEEIRRVWVNRRKDGGRYHEEVRIRPFVNAGGEITHLVFMVHDISARVQQMERIAYLANFDILTGLPNRTLFKDRLNREFIHVSRHGGGFALLFVDLDLFKPINDLYGHATGDLVLREVGALLRQCVRREDTVARLGGDEFALILKEVTCRNDAGEIIHTVLKTLHRGTFVEGRTLSLSASIGVCLVPADGSDEASLLRRADNAMYRAKTAGGNGYCFFDPDQDDRREANSTRFGSGDADRRRPPRGPLALACKLWMS